MSTNYQIPNYQAEIQTTPCSIYSGRYSIFPEEPITVQCISTNPLIKINYCINDIWTEYTAPYVMDTTTWLNIRFDIESLTEDAVVDFINLSDNNSTITQIFFKVA